ncbi:MAG: hypothetical protein M3444_00140 [Acidobacteriota bacterium]|nr:hypothetical protein [Acidobacteriota bacterium]MDQ5835725.1 hypothetical protein [Acidobacteriota bacterium]
MTPDKDDEVADRRQRRVAKRVLTSKAIKLPKVKWREVERTILEAAASLYLLLYCIELLGHKAQTIFQFIKAFH